MNAEIERSSLNLVASELDQEEPMGSKSPEENKAMVLEAFDTLFNKRDQAKAAEFWSENYIQHSAHIEPGRDGLFNLVRSSPATLRYENTLIVAEGNYLMLHGRFSRPDAKASQGIIQNWWRQGMMGSALAHYEGIKAFSETDQTDDLKAITVPTLVMQGDDDQVVPYKDASVLQAKLLKHATLKIYPGFSHGMLTTNADVINADILAFMQFEFRRIGGANSSAETYGG